jgi:predicted lipid-binding transport protein (Tim44 family)
MRWKTPCVAKIQDIEIALSGAKDLFMKLKNGLMAWAMALASVLMVAVPTMAEAKRLGGGRPAGMQRQMPSKPANATPNQAPANSNAAAPAQGVTPPAAAPKRNWMGPIAGLAAGLGIAALMSHFGMGEAMGNFMMMALLGVAAVFLIGWLMRRFGGAKMAGPQLAGAGAPFQNAPLRNEPQAQQPMARDMFTPGASSPVAPAAAFQPAAAAPAVPDGFDTAGFERIAKMIFIRLQAANDEANLDDIRKFTTPELFASLRLDLQERGTAKQQTDVMQLDAQVVDTAQEQGQWVASVRFSGLIREEIGAGAHAFNELWHLVKPVDDSREWAIAGITPIEG